jgi:hypothetical protein
MIGIEVAKRAIRCGGDYNTAIDSTLVPLLAADLQAQSWDQTYLVRNKTWDDWYEIAPPKLLRRNFDGALWEARMPYDVCPTPPAWLNPATFRLDTRRDFEYQAFGGTDLPGLLANLQQARTDFVAANSGKDRP